MDSDSEDHHISVTLVDGKTVGRNKRKYRVLSGFLLLSNISALNLIDLK